ncbi:MULTISPECIES: TraB/GumN family protein [unclassified Roseitalea]|uniref:TraB/GumN family protein n=1 Tax=unclassified Roseitalea TaxID=2639107 RepID=UPI00273FF97E|nr:MULTISPECIES: TraB/GumN family protein [unclassified Roseitalea]
MRITSLQAIAVADRLSGPALSLLAAINVLFVAVVLGTAFAAGARAETLPACQGRNLLESLKADEPGTYADILAAGEATINGDTLLFRIERDGLAPSHVFGTMHMTDPRVTELPPAAAEAFDAARTVAIETTEILDPQQAQTALLSKPELTMFTGTGRLSDFLDDADRQVLKDGLAERGLQLALIDRMKPWLVAGMVALPECETARKQAGAQILDIALAMRAKAEGKRLVGLETMVEQLEAMASLPMAFHVKGLVETVALGAMIDDINETMVMLYDQGRIGLVWPVLRAMAPAAAGDDVGYAEFERTMVNARNRTMAERAMPLIEQGGAFIAVGALHLPGEEGVPELLARAGYQVTPVR